MHVCMCVCVCLSACAHACTHVYMHLCAVYMVESRDDGSYLSDASILHVFEVESLTEHEA